VKDLEIVLEDRPGALAQMGETLGRAGVSIEGGGVFVTGGAGVGHFLFEDGHAARTALEGAGIRVAAENEVVVLRLRQDEPGQLGTAARRMAEAGVNVVVQYSDHEHRLVLVVDDVDRGQAVAREWTRRNLRGTEDEEGDG
jgi:hypothetical protein